MPTLTLARINWKHYTTGGAAAVSETTRRKGRLDLSQLMIMCFNFIWFCSGQGAPSHAARTREGTLTLALTLTLTTHEHACSLLRTAA